MVHDGGKSDWLVIPAKPPNSALVGCRGGAGFASDRAAFVRRHTARAAILNAGAKIADAQRSIVVASRVSSPQQTVGYSGTPSERV